MADLTTPDAALPPAVRDSHEYVDAHGGRLYSIRVTPTGYAVDGNMPALGRPILNLDSITHHAIATILIVDGEKFINGARACLPEGWQITTWHGPIEATDWTCLGSRRCVVWPSPRGAERAAALVDHLSGLHAHVGIVDVPRAFPGNDGARQLMIDAAAAIVPPVNGKHVPDAVDLAEREAIRIVEAAPTIKRVVDESGADIVIDPAAPWATAHALLKYTHTYEETRTIHHQQGIFYSWLGTRYAHIASEHARASIYRFLEQVYEDHKSTTRPFKPTRNDVNDVLDALRSAAQLAPDVQAPTWLAPRAWQPAAAEVIACRNGLLHLPTGKMYPHTPLFFSHTALGYDYQPDAEAPKQWLKFLSDIWGDDAESIASLQDIFGYLLGNDTDQQKLFLLVGPKRSGKGTIGRIINALLGDDAVISPTLASLETPFGIAPMIGKTVALIADARLSGKQDQAAIAERLLSISGEDKQTLDRKYLDPWSGRLGVRFFIMTNELPRIADSSGALASRFIVMTMIRSFYGTEDRGLTKRLLAELPGILNWALVGWRRLRERGNFLQPKSSDEAIRELEDLGSPMGAFVRDCCVVGPERSCGPDVIYAAWQAWCTEQGRDHKGTKQTFGRDLRAVIPGIEIVQPRNSGTRSRMYQGVGLISNNVRSHSDFNLDSV